MPMLIRTMCMHALKTKRSIWIYEHCTIVFATAAVEMCPRTCHGILDTSLSFSYIVGNIMFLEEFHNIKSSLVKCDILPFVQFYRLYNLCINLSSSIPIRFRVVGHEPLGSYITWGLIEMYTMKNGRFCILILHNGEYIICKISGNRFKMLLVFRCIRNGYHAPNPKSGN